MYEQYDGTRQYQNPFCPHPEILEVYPVFYGVTKPKKIEMKKENIQTVEEKTDEIRTEIQKEEPEIKETSLTVTNNVNYEVKDEIKHGLFKRR